MSEILLKQITLYAVAIINLGIALYVLAKNHRHASHQAFFLMFFGVSSWTIGITLLSHTGQFGIFDKISLYGGICAIAGFAFFARVFPESAHPSKRFWFSLIPLLFLATILPFNLVMKDVLVSNSGTLEPINGPLFPLFAVIEIAYIIYAIILFVRHYKKTTPIQRQRIAYFFFGISIFLIVNIFVSIILPAFDIFHLNIIGPLSSIVLVGSTAYAILRHQLMDIRIIIQRSLIYTVVFSITLGIYISISTLLARIFTVTADASAIWSGVITLIIGFLGMTHLEALFKKITDRWFFKDTYNYSDALHTLSDILNTNVQFNSIVYESIIALRKIFKVTHVEYYVFEDNLCFSEQGKTKLDITFPKEYLTERIKNAQVMVMSELAEMIHNSRTPENWNHHIYRFIQKEATARNIAVTAPVVLDTKMIGVIGVGEKLSGDAFTTEDIMLLKTFASQAAVALEKARLYTKVETHAKELEQKVHERTYEIQKLQKSQEQMIVDISHNLQTPLTILKGELEKLRRTNTLNSEDFKKLEDSISRVSNFIYRLLQLSKAGASKKHIKFNLSNLIANSVEYFTTVAEDQNINLVSTIEDNIHLFGDPQHIEEVLTNLVSNAIKYRRTDTPTTITINLSIDQDVGNIHVSIQDNGKGIAQKDLGNIFNRFYRACNSGDLADLKGTGLGLAISKKIIEKYNGSILVDSKLGFGTTFTIVIPLQDD
jgi:signal transduction histidine kinase